MHTCPYCGEECDCDLDDTGDLPVPASCPHICDDPVDDDYDDLDVFDENYIVEEGE